MARRGRPPLYLTCLDLDAKCEEYFEWADEREWAYTVEDLACHCLMLTDTLGEYGNKPDFAGVVKRAKQRIYASWARRLAQSKQNAVGCIFLLKNWAGYVDQQQVTQDSTLTVKVEGLPALNAISDERQEQVAITASYKELPDE